MSTRADCTIWENEKGQWFYDLQRYPYGDTSNYDRYGPFSSQDEADRHLSDNHANPGGFWLLRFDPEKPYNPSYQVQAHSARAERKTFRVGGAYSGRRW